MGFLKKIFGGEQSPKKQSNKKSPQRAPRISQLSLDGVCLKVEPIQKDLQVANISYSGMGLVISNWPGCPQVGKTVRGRLSLRDEEVDIAAEIVHQTGTVAGIRFTEGDLEVARMVRKFFDLELSALQLIEVNPSALKKVDRGSPHWYRGSNQCELYLIEDQEKILSFNLSFYGNYVEGGSEQKFRYGTIVQETDPDNPMNYKGSEIVRYESSIPPEMKSSVERFVRHIKKLPLHFKDQIVDFLH